MNPLIHLARELRQLAAVRGPTGFLRYTAALGRLAPAVLRARSLALADLAMAGTIAMRVNDARLQLPLDTMRDGLAHFDPTPTFGGAREMYACNVYLRQFKAGLRGATVVDLGSNRGLFLLLAAKVLGATRGLGVEPQVA